MESIIISKAKKENIKRIVKIHKRCVLKTNSTVYSRKLISFWLQQISEKNVLSQFKNTSWIVIKESNKVIGFAQYGLGTQTLYQIQIDPDFQGKGYGKKIYDYIEKVFIQNRLKKIYLNSTLNALNFYINRKFKAINKVFINEIELVNMEKDLVW